MNENPPGVTPHPRVRFRWGRALRLALLVLLPALAVVMVRMTVRGRPADAGMSGQNVAAFDSGTVFSSGDCMRCHQVVANFSHPTGVRPSMTVPSALPLENGTVTCTTCHDGTASAHAQARSAHNGLLRTAFTGLGFCNQCHASGDMTRQSQHPGAFAVAHTRVPKLAANLGIASTAKARDVEDTRSCLTCHDGTLATDIRASEIVTGTGGTSHPVGVNYLRTMASKGGLVDSARLDSRIRLYQGQVACGSCHSLYSGERGLLVLANDHSKLCMTCHILR